MKMTRFEAELIEQAARKLDTYFSSNPFTESAAKLQVLGVEKSGLSEKQVASCQLLLDRYNSTAGRIETVRKAVRVAENLLKGRSLDTDDYAELVALIYGELDGGLSEDQVLENARNRDRDS